MPRWGVALYSASPLLVSVPPAPHWDKASAHSSRGPKRGQALTRGSFGFLSPGSLVAPSITDRRPAVKPLPGAWGDTMGHKQVLFRSEAREKVLRGATTLADAIRVTAKATKVSPLED
jgi:hypothetical protein